MAKVALHNLSAGILPVPHPFHIMLPPSQGRTVSVTITQLVEAKNSPSIAKLVKANLLGWGPLDAEAVQVLGPAVPLAAVPVEPETAVPDSVASFVTPSLQVSVAITPSPAEMLKLKEAFTGLQDAAEPDEAEEPTQPSRVRNGLKEIAKSEEPALAPEVAAIDEDAAKEFVEALGEPGSAKEVLVPVPFDEEPGAFEPAKESTTDDGAEPAAPKASKKKAKAKKPKFE